MIERLNIWDPAALRAARAYLGLTQEQLGVRVGVGHSAVARWESGSTEPNANMIGLLCDALRIKVDQLYRRADDNTLARG